MLEKIVKKSSLIAPILAVTIYSTNADAADNTAEQTKQELTQEMRRINSTYFVNNPQDKRRGYWSRVVNLIDSGKEVVLLQENGKTYFGVDGVGQVLDKNHLQPSTENHKLDLSERIPNFTVPFTEGTMPEDGHYAFDGLSKVPQEKQPVPKTYTPNIVLVPGPADVIEKEVPSILISAGAGYLHLFAEKDEKYDFNGVLRGGKAFVTLHPRNTNWYFGSEAMVYGSQSAAFEAIEVPAKDGPLAGQLVMKGTNEYSLSALGIGLGLVGGYLFRGEEGELGIGIELYAGIMHDWVTKELTENSAHYINDHRVEGTNISNTTSDTESQVHAYSGLGFRLNWSDFCIIPYLGFRTNLSDSIPPMGGLSVGYCPQ